MVEINPQKCVDTIRTRELTAIQSQGQKLDFIPFVLFSSFVGIILMRLLSYGEFRLERLREREKLSVAEENKIEIQRARD